MAQVMGLVGAAQAKEVPLLYQIGNRLSEGVKALDGQHERMEQLAQRLLGPVPSAVEKSADEGIVNHATGTLLAITSQLERRIGQLENTLRRLEQL